MFVFLSYTSLIIDYCEIYNKLLFLGSEDFCNCSLSQMLWMSLSVYNHCLKCTSCAFKILNQSLFQSVTLEVLLSVGVAGWEEDVVAEERWSWGQWMVAVGRGLLAGWEEEAVERQSWGRFLWVSSREMTPRTLMSGDIGSTAWQTGYSLQKPLRILRYSLEYPELKGWQ